MDTMLRNPEQFASQHILDKKKPEKPYRLTPYIVTFSEGTITDIDIRNFLEAGLRVVRFKISHITSADKVLLLTALKKAIAWCCDKYESTNWPVAVSVDLANACILTGYLKGEVNSVILRKNTTIEVTSDIQYWNKCDENRVFIDDYFTLATLKPDTEISINFGSIVLTCTEVISDKCIKCIVDLGGYLESAQFVCIRGVKLKRPALGRQDRRLLNFVKEHQLDVITVYSIRGPTTIEKVRAYFKGSHVQPAIMAAICEQEGLDAIDSIVEAADGIILAREFLALSIKNPNRMTAIQLYVGAKCRKHGKPFYISGNVLENTLKYGTLQCHELNDITNAVLQGAGFVLKNFGSAANITATMDLLNTLCKFVETLSLNNCYWDMCSKLPPPVTAADAAILACALTVQQTATEIIIVLTVTGQTAIKLARMTPQAAILSVSSDLTVAKRLQLYRGITPIVFKKTGTEDWYANMKERVHFAIEYGLKHELLKDNQSYVVLRKGTPSSAFCDEVSAWKIVVEATKNQKISCTNDGQPLHHHHHPPLIKHNF